MLDGVPADGTVMHLKQIIEQRHGVPVAEQKLIFAGRAMENAETLAENNVQHQTSVMLVHTPAPPAVVAAVEAKAAGLVAVAKRGPHRRDGILNFDRGWRVVCAHDQLTTPPSPPSARPLYLVLRPRHRGVCTAALRGIK